MHAATANKFVNKAEVISVKSEHAKKHKHWTWRQKQSNKFLTSLPWNNAKLTTNCSKNVMAYRLNTPKMIKEKEQTFIHPGLLVYRNLHSPRYLDSQLTNAFKYHLRWKFLTISPSLLGRPWNSVYHLRRIRSALFCFQWTPVFLWLATRISSGFHPCSGFGWPRSYNAVWLSARSDGIPLPCPPCRLEGAAPKSSYFSWK